MKKVLFLLIIIVCLLSCRTEQFYRNNGHIYKSKVEMPKVIKGNGYTDAKVLIRKAKIGACKFARQ